MLQPLTSSRNSRTAKHKQGSKLLIHTTRSCSAVNTVSRQHETEAVHALTDKADIQSLLNYQANQEKK